MCVFSQSASEQAGGVGWLVTSVKNNENEKELSLSSLFDNRCPVSRALTHSHSLSLPLSLSLDTTQLRNVSRECGDVFLYFATISLIYNRFVCICRSIRKLKTICITLVLVYILFMFD